MLDVSCRICDQHMGEKRRHGRSRGRSLGQSQRARASVRALCAGVHRRARRVCAGRALAPDRARERRVHDQGGRLRRRRVRLADGRAEPDLAIDGRGSHVDPARDATRETVVHHAAAQRRAPRNRRRRQLQRLSFRRRRLDMDEGAVTPGDTMLLLDADAAQHHRRRQLRVPRHLQRLPRRPECELHLSLPRRRTHLERRLHLDDAPPRSRPAVRPRHARALRVVRRRERRDREVHERRRLVAADLLHVHRLRRDRHRLRLGLRNLRDRHALPAEQHRAHRSLVGTDDASDAGASRLVLRLRARLVALPRRQRS